MVGHADHSRNLNLYQFTISGHAPDFVGIVTGDPQGTVRAGGNSHWPHAHGLEGGDLPVGVNASNLVCPDHRKPHRLIGPYGDTQSTATFVWQWILAQFAIEGHTPDLV